jgi:hypothetical protein
MVAGEAPEIAVSSRCDFATSIGHFLIDKRRFSVRFAPKVGFFAPFQLNWKCVPVLVRGASKGEFVPCTKHCRCNSRIGTLVGDKACKEAQTDQETQD